MVVTPDEIVVTVALPAFNAERTIRSAVLSVLGQSFRQFELLVIDDGSTDRTLEELAEIPDPRLRILHDGRRGGLAGRLNQAMDLARGRYMARMDADDICLPERLEKQVAFLDANPAVDLVATRAVVFGEGGQVIGLLPFVSRHDQICRQPWRGFSMPHPTWMGRVAWFRRHRYRQPEVVRAEDQELLLRAYPSSRFACLDEVLLGYRQGQYDFRRLLRARKSMWLAYSRTFLERGQIHRLMLATAMAGMRMASDAWDAVGQGDGLLARRLDRRVPEEVLTAWRQTYLALEGRPQRARSPG